MDKMRWVKWKNRRSHTPSDEEGNLISCQMKKLTKDNNKCRY